MSAVADWVSGFFGTFGTRGPAGLQGVKFRLTFWRPFAPCFGRLVASPRVYLLDTCVPIQRHGMYRDK